MNKQYHEVLADYFIKGYEEEAVKYIDDLLTEYPKLYLYEDIITPAMYHIGYLWENNEISVADEHLATAVCDFVLTRLENWMYENRDFLKNDKKVVLVGAENEQHYIGLKMVASYYRENGWNVRYLGPNLPMNHSLKFFKQWQPDVIGISAALTYRLPSVKKSAEIFSQLDWDPTVLIGGRMAKENDLSMLEKDRVHVIKSFEDLNRFHSHQEVGEMDETS